MLPFQGYGVRRSLYDDQELSCSTKNKINGGDSSSSSSGELMMMMMITKPPETTESASEKHALSERKRRKRINCHYDSLRQLFPQLLKTDKASVLTETVRRLKELRNMVADVAKGHDDGESRRLCFLPGEYDELTISNYDGGNKIAVQVTFCCDDRPGLNRDLTEAIQSVRGKAVKAEMATIGGRTKAVVVVEWPEGGGGGDEDVVLLRRALRAVVENRALGYHSKWAGLGQEFVDCERPKIYDPLENGLAEGLILRSN